MAKKYGTLNGLKYCINDEKAIITECINFINQPEIPNIIDGYPVTAIGNRAFFDAPFTDVKIPEGITKIGDGAFMVTGLTNIILPATLTEIGLQAFCGCTGLIAITIPKGVNLIDFWTFDNCRSLTDVFFLGHATTIDSRAFDNCKDLTIHCYKDSNAHRYAMEYKYSVKLFD